MSDRTDDGWIDGWTEEEWEAFHNVPCPDVEETTINFTFTCPPERSTLLGVPEGEQGVRLPEGDQRSAP